jgi:hypothetical protein
VNLEKGTEKIAGKVKAAKDGNSADLQFDPAALSDGAGIYELMLVDKSSNELDSGEAVQLEVQPLITSADSSLDLSQANPTLTIKGKHLDKLGSALLVADDDSSGPVKGTLPAATQVASNATSISVSFTASQLKSGKQYFVRYAATGLGNSQNPVDLKTIIVKTSGTVPAAAPGKPVTQPADVKPAAGKPVVSKPPVVKQH